MSAFITGPTESCMNTEQAQITLISCIPGITKIDVLFLKVHPRPTYLHTLAVLLLPPEILNLQCDCLIKTLLCRCTFLSGQNFRPRGMDTKQGQRRVLGMAEVWEGSWEGWGCLGCSRECKRYSGFLSLPQMTFTSFSLILEYRFPLISPQPLGCAPLPHQDEGFPNILHWNGTWSLCNIGKLNRFQTRCFDHCFL